MPRTSLARRTFVPVLGGIGILAGIALVLWVMAVVISRTDDVRLGDQIFDLGPATNRARSIDEDGAPFFFQDLLTNGSRDIFVSHAGGDPLVGWSAFAARSPGSPRRCTLVTTPGADALTDPCSGRSYPLDGTGLPQYPVTVGADGHLRVDLTPEGEPGGGTTVATD